MQTGLGARELPEMLFLGGLACIQEGTGTELRLDTEDALREWMQEGNEPPRVKAAAEWQEGHRKRFQEGRRPAIGELREEGRDEAFDWTFTTPYGGTAKGSEWREAKPNEQVNRELLTRRDPILLYEEGTLYESELDDAGISSLHYKVRVMPRCWYVLLRFYLRIDGVIIRLREHRIYCEFRSSSGRDLEAYQQALVRESSGREVAFHHLEEAGAPAHPSAFKDPDKASHILTSTFGPSECSVQTLECRRPA